MIVLGVGSSYYFRFELLEPALPISKNSSLLGLFLVSLGNFVLLWSLYSFLQFRQLLDENEIVVENGKWQFSIAAIIGITVLTAFAMEW
jgi:hypothetical protein